MQLDPATQFYIHDLDIVSENTMIFFFSYLGSCHILLHHFLTGMPDLARSIVSSINEKTCENTSRLNCLESQSFKTDAFFSFLYLLLVSSLRSNSTCS